MFAEIANKIAVAIMLLSILTVPTFTTDNIAASKLANPPIKAAKKIPLDPKNLLNMPDTNNKTIKINPNLIAKNNLKGFDNCKSFSLAVVLFFLYTKLKYKVIKDKIKKGIISLILKIGFNKNTINNTRGYITDVANKMPLPNCEQ